MSCEQFFPSHIGNPPLIGEFPCVANFPDFVSDSYRPTPYPHAEINLVLLVTFHEST